MNFNNVEEHLICMKCGGNLKVAYDKGTEGIITCLKCSANYPIIKNVPRFLEGELLKNCYYFYHDVIEKDHRLNKYFTDQSELKKISDKTEKLKSKTQEQFGYEWGVWKKLPEFAENHFFEVMGKSPEFFKEKFGWDPAVGNGRDLFNACKAVGNKGLMIGSDISFSVDIAYERCKKFDNVLIVQGDLYSDFIREEYLDFAYMIGLIQHLTQPEEGVEKVFKKVKKGGYFVGTVYTKPKDFLSKVVVGFVLFMRKFTLKIPLSVTLFISRILALPAYLFFKLPKFILNRFGYVKNMNELYPTHGTQKRKPSLDLLAHNWFDNFTPPIVGYYSDEEIVDMTKDVSWDSYELSQGIFRGYRR